MAQFPYSRIPPEFEKDDFTASFMEDIRKLATQMKVFGTRVSIVAGNGSPEGQVTERGGSLYLRQDGPPWFYVKQTAAETNTGWVAK